MTEVVERIFGGKCRGGCLHKQGSENEAEPTILQGIQCTLY